MRQRSIYPWPSPGPALGLAGWSFAMLAARRVFGDLPSPRGIPDHQAVASIDFGFHAYSTLAVLSMVAAVLVATFTWRTARRWSVATIGVVSLFALTVAGAAFSR
jgi:hypothetical protein